MKKFPERDWWAFGDAYPTDVTEEQWTCFIAGPDQLSAYTFGPTKTDAERVAREIVLLLNAKSPTL